MKKLLCFNPIQDLKRIRNFSFMKVCFVVSFILFAGITNAANDTQSVTQERKTVTGVVTENGSETLPGVAVSIKGTSMGTSTDADGKYSLNVESNSAVLVFSYIGMKTQEITVGNRTTLNVNMEGDTEILEEIVVIGYGTQIKKDLTGAVGAIAQEKLENQATVGIANNLQGRLAGVRITQRDGTPYGGTSIRIRGNGSFGASSSPLYVVDGMITTGGLSHLNQNDVENITILKDAASAAIYGSRGANGVVIITTKRGGFERPLKIDIQAYTAVDNIRHKVEKLNAIEYATMVNDYYAAASLPIPYTQQELDSYGKGTDWIDEITQSGFKHNVSLSVTGGTQKSAYAFTANLYKGEGVVKRTTSTNGSVKMSNDYALFSNLKLGSSLSVNYRFTDNADWGQALDRAMIYPATVPAYDANGDYGICSHHGEPVTMLQPLIAIYLRSYEQTNKRLLGNVYLEWDIIKDLKFKTTINAEYSDYYQDRFVPSYSYGPKGMVSDHPIAELYVSNNNTIMYQWDNILTYNKSFDGTHNVTAMAGYTFQKSDYKTWDASRTTFLNNDKNLQVLNAGSENINNSGNKEAWAIQSYLGRVSYDYMRKYLLSASLRIDQTSRISKDNRTGIFPGASAGWVVSEEGFMKDATMFSYLKLRGSWGILGNQDIGTYPYQTTLNSGSLYYPFGSGNEGTTFTGVGPTSMGNSNLLWEKTATVGGGLEANFFQNRLTFVMDYYKRNTSDILVRVPILWTSGVTTAPYQNAGKVSNTGFEFTLGYNNYADKSDFTYDVSVNWTYNKNEVTYIPAPIINNFDRVAVGQPINDWYGYVQEGIFQTREEIANSPRQPNASPGDIKYKDLNDDKVINSNDQEFLGHRVPPHTYGGSIFMGYKDFDFVVSFIGQMGALNSIDAPGFAITRGGEQGSAWMFNQRWTGEGTSNYIPRVVAGDPNDNYRRSSFWLRSTDFFRLQNMQIGYNFDKMLKGSPVKKLRLYLATQNLFCINSYPGWDPEQGANGYPIPRSFYVGLNVGF